MNEAAQELIDDGFQFAKGSKKGITLQPDLPKPKRQKMNQEIREARSKQLE